MTDAAGADAHAPQKSHEVASHARRHGILTMPVPCGLVHPELVVRSRGLLPSHQSGSQGALWLGETQQPSELEGGAWEIRGGPFERLLPEGWSNLGGDLIMKSQMRLERC